MALSIPTWAVANDAVDTVVLNDGTKLRGIVIEDDPQTGVSIKLLDGTIRQAKRATVQRVDYGKAPAPQTAPAPLPSAAPVAAAPPIAAPVQPAPPPLQTRPASPPADPSEEEVRHGLPAIWATGLAIFGAAYVAGIAVTAATAADQQKAKSVGYACIPLGGGFAALADGSIEKQGGDTALIVADTILQNAGAALFIIGLTVPRRESSSANFYVVPGPGAVRLQGTF